MSLVQDPGGGGSANVVDAVTPGSMTGKKGLVVHVATSDAGGDASEATLAARLSEADFDARVGEVQAAPTANTILGRLKDVYDKLSAFIVARVSDGLGNALTSTDEGGGVRSLDVAIKSGSTSGPTATEDQALGTAGVPMIGKDHAGNAQFLPVATSGQAKLAHGFQLMGTDDTFLRDVRVRVNGAMRVENIPYLYQIASGHVPGHEAVRKQAHGTFATTARALLIGGQWNEQSSGAQRSLVSTDAADAAAGTGARQVRLDYITGAGLASSEIITLNGVTPVDTVAVDIKWINQMSVIAVGTGGLSAGDVSLMSAVTGGGVVVSQIQAGHNQGHYGIHYVPTDKTLGLVLLQFNATDKFLAEVWSTIDYTAEGGGLVEVLHNEAYFDKKGAEVAMPIQLIVPGGGRVYTMVTPDVSGESLYVTMYGWQE